MTLRVPNEWERVCMHQERAYSCIHQPSFESGLPRSFALMRGASGNLQVFSFFANYRCNQDFY